jgi:hypothetical protein
MLLWHCCIDDSVVIIVLAARPGPNGGSQLLHNAVACQHTQLVISATCTAGGTTRTAMCEAEAAGDSCGDVC